MDHQLPYVPVFIVIMCLAYVGRGLRADLPGGARGCEPLFGEMIAKLFCFVIFMPAHHPGAPGETGSGFFGWGVRVIYFFDPPNALFPSIHCLENWIVWRGHVRPQTGGPRRSRPGSGDALLVFASTLLVKQHVVVDIPAGIAGRGDRPDDQQQACSWASAMPPGAAREVEAA